MRRRFLSKSEIKELNGKMGFDFQLPPKGRVEVVIDEFTLILLEGKPVLFEYEGKWLPSLHVLQEKQLLKRITVDMGAIKFVTSGADIMRPGITKIDDGLNAGDAAVIVDETHGKALAVGIVMVSSEELRATDKGKVVKNIHYIGDALWNFGKGVE